MRWTGLSHSVLRLVAAATLFLLPSVVAADRKPGAARVGDVAKVRHAARGPRGEKIEKRRRENRKAWKKLSPEKRSELKRLKVRLEKLPGAKRARLLTRLRGLDQAGRRRLLRQARARLDKKSGKLDAETKRLRRRFFQELPPEQRRQLRALSSAERSTALEKVRRDTLASLPPRMRRRIAALKPRQQVIAVRRFRARQTLRRVAGGTDALAALREIPRERLLRALRSQHEGEASTPERPDFLSPAAWLRWQQLKPWEQLRVLNLLRERHAPEGNTASTSLSPRSDWKPADSGLEVNLPAIPFEAHQQPEE